MFPGTPQILVDDPSGSREAHRFDSSNVLHAHRTSCDERRVTINIIPEDVLLHIFHFDRLVYLDGLEDVDLLRLSWRWDRLVHVCRRWRSVVFASPNFLGLKLVCTPWTCMRLTAIWPPFPIILTNIVGRNMATDYDLDSVVVHRNRICAINFHDLSDRQCQRLASAMREQFPLLVHLRLGCSCTSSHIPLALPNRFLGGSAPHLQSLELDRIPFPALPRLLLSATNIIHLALVSTPHTWYTDPGAIVTGLATLASLKFLTMTFLGQPYRESRHPPPPTRTILPALSRFVFGGVTGYLEELLALIEAPSLDSIYITFFHRPIFNTQQLSQLMRRTTGFQALNEVYVDFDGAGVQVGHFPRTFDRANRLRILCRKLDEQLLSLAQVLTSFFPSIYMVEHLYISGTSRSPPYLRHGVVNMQWLGIFHPFTAVKNLYVSKEYAPLIAPAMQDLVGERTKEVFPTLENIFLEGLRPSEPIQEGFGTFVAARQLFGIPITVSLWERD